ncbi:hypothetical protein HanRHA438_Chr16g0759891 [Helianthus annuus]|nr:hypothetical protein HanRHA438_Chr16g0759891 [Helianthus annuus]
MIHDSIRRPCCFTPSDLLSDLNIHRRRSFEIFAGMQPRLHLAFDILFLNRGI